MKLSDQLGQGVVEHVVVEGQRLGRRELDPHAREPLPGRLRERDRRLHRRHPLVPDHGDELGGQGTRSAAHVEGSPAGAHARGDDERSSELTAVAADMAVVGLRRSLERRSTGRVAHVHSLAPRDGPVKWRDPGTNRA